MAEWWGPAAWLLFEAAAGVCAWRLAGRFFPGVERVAAGLALSVLLTAWPPWPWLPWVLLAAFGFAAWRLGPGPRCEARTGPLLACVLAVLAFCVRPVGEPDSLFNLHFVFGWIDRGAALHDFAFHYVPYWETAYVPSLRMAGTDAFLWIVSLKAIALLGALLWLVAGEFGLAGRLRVAAWANAMLFVHLWHGPSGLSTIKNDMIAAAGQAALALALLRLARGQFGRAEQGLVVAGAIFVSTKFSGPVLLALTAPLFLWGWRSLWGWKGQWRAQAGWLAAGTALWFATVGHVYVRNAWLHGNPVYPFQLNLGPVRLPGLGDLSHTSILYSLREPEVWQRFFLPEGGLSPLGLLFPLTLAVLPFAVWRARALFAAYTVAALFVYVRSIFSASGQPGDLQFVRNDLNSFRYVEGAYLAGELCLVGLLSRWPRAALAAAGVSLLSRVWILGERVGPLPAPEWRVFGMAMALGAAAVWLAFRRSRWTGAALLLLASAGALMVESRRGAWLPEWRALYGPLYKRAPGAVFLVVDDAYSEQACAHLPLKGQRLHRQVNTGPRGQWHGERYVVWMRRPGQSEPAPPGYRVVARNAAGVLWEVVPR